mmetsp:Transcript_18839/g.47583  ORF Transcript_18839/g.47583 Transcript_18839/m.47583 type:complete len:86 (+) Transcript_18839:2-259(+)
MNALCTTTPGLKNVQPIATAHRRTSGVALQSALTSCATSVVAESYTPLRGMGSTIGPQEFEVGGICLVVPKLQRFQLTFKWMHFG